MSHLPPSPGVKLVGDADFQQLPTPAGDGPTQIELHEDTPEGLDREQKEREGQNKQTLAEAIRECQELLARISRDCIHVEHRVITKNAFKTKATVGLMLTGVSIDTLVVGGPGYAMGDKLRKGDKITHVDGLAATQDNVLALLVGKDQPGTSVQITVKSAATARTSTLTLTRAATSQIADRCALYEMFTQLKNKIMKDKVGVGVVPQLDSILHLWSSMIVADEEHDNTVASNITNLQDEERAGLDQLLRLLLELQDGVARAAEAPKIDPNALRICKMELQVSRQQHREGKMRLGELEVQLLDHMQRIKALEESLAAKDDDAAKLRKELQEQKERLEKAIQDQKDKLAKEMLARERETAALRDELKAARAQVASLTQDKTAFQAQLDVAQKGLQQASNEAQDLRKQLENTGQALTRSEQEEKRWREEAYKFKSEVQNLSHAKTLLDDKVSRLDSTVGVLKGEVAERDGLVAARDAEAKELQKQLGALTAQLEEAKASVLEEKALHAKCAQQVEGLEKELAQSRSQCKAEVLAHSAAKDEIASLQARLMRLEEELRVVPVLHKTNSELKGEVSSKDLACKDLGRQLAEMQGDCAVLKASLEHRTRTETELNQEIGKLQQEVAQHQRLAARAAAETASFVQQAKAEAEDAATSKRLLQQSVDQLQAEARTSERQLGEAKREASAGQAALAAEQDKLAHAQRLLTQSHADAARESQSHRQQQQAWTQQMASLTSAALRLMAAISAALTFDTTSSEALPRGATAAHDAASEMVEDAAGFVEAVPRTCDMVAAWHTRTRDTQAALQAERLSQVKKENEWGLERGILAEDAGTARHALQLARSQHLQAVNGLQEATAALKAIKDQRDACISALHRLRTGHKAYVDQLHERAHELERVVNGSVSAHAAFKVPAAEMWEALLKEKEDKVALKKELSALRNVADQRLMAATKADAQLQAAIGKAASQQAALTRVEQEREELTRETQDLRGKLQSSQQHVRALEGLHQEAERVLADQRRQHEVALHEKTAELQQTAKTLDETRVQGKLVATRVAELQEELETMQAALIRATNELSQSTSSKDRLSAQLLAQEQAAAVEQQQATATQERQAAECCATVDACKALLAAIQGDPHAAALAVKAPHEALQFVLAHVEAGCEEAKALRKALEEQRSLNKTHAKALALAEEQWQTQLAELRRQLEGDRDQLVRQRDALIESGKRADADHNAQLSQAKAAAQDAQSEADKHERALAARTKEVLALSPELERTKGALEAERAQRQGVANDLADARSQVLGLQDRLTKESDEGRMVRVERDAAQERLLRLQYQLEEATRDRDARGLKLADCEQSCENMVRELGELRASQSRLKHQAQELSTANEQQAHTASQQRAAAAQELESTRLLAAQRWQALDQDCQAKSKQLAQLEPEIQEERAARALLQDQLDASESKAAQLQTHVTSVQGRLEKEQARAQAQQEELEQKRKVLQASQDAAADLEERLAACAADFKAATARICTLDDGLKQALAQKNALAVEVDELKHELQGLRQQMEGLAVEGERKERQMQEDATDLQQLRQELQGEIVRRDKAESEAAQSRSKLLLEVQARKEGAAALAEATAAYELQLAEARDTIGHLDKDLAGARMQLQDCETARQKREAAQELLLNSTLDGARRLESAISTTHSAIAAMVGEEQQEHDATTEPSSAADSVANSPKTPASAAGDAHPNQVSQPFAASTAGSNGTGHAGPGAQAAQELLSRVPGACSQAEDAEKRAAELCGMNAMLRRRHADARVEWQQEFSELRAGLEKESAQLRKDRDELRQTLNENMAITAKKVRELQAEIAAREQTQIQTEESMRTLHLDFSPIVAKLESQLASLRKHQGDARELAATRQHLWQAKQREDTLSGENRGLRARIESLTSREGQLQVRVSAGMTEVDRLQAALLESETTRDALARQLATSKADVARLERQVSDLGRRISDVQQQTASDKEQAEQDLRQVRQESAAVLDARDSALRHSASKQTHLDTSLAECAAALAKAKEENHDLRLEKETLASELSLLKAGKASATKLAEQAEQELLAVRASLHEMEDKVKDMNKTCGGLSSQLEATKVRAKDLDKALSDGLSERDQLASTLAQVEGRLEDVMRQAAALSASEARLERQLADTAARKDEALEDARTTQALRLQEEQAAAAKIQDLQAQLEKRQQQLLEASKREQGARDDMATAQTLLHAAKAEHTAMQQTNAREATLAKMNADEQARQLSVALQAAEALLAAILQGPQSTGKAGVGLVLENKTSSSGAATVVVAKIAPETQEAFPKLKAGDAVLSVGGVSTVGAGSKAADVMQMLLGPAGQHVQVSFRARAAKSSSSKPADAGGEYSLTLLRGKLEGSTDSATHFKEPAEAVLSEVPGAVAALTDLRCEVKDAKKSVAALTQEAAASQAKNAAMFQELRGQLEGEANAIRDALEQTAQERDKARREVAELQRKLQQTEMEAIKAQEQALATSMALAQAESEAQRDKASLERSTHEAKKSSADLLAMRGTLAEAEKKDRELSNEARALAAQLQASQARAAALKTDLEKNEMDRESLVNQLADSQREVETASRDLLAARANEAAGRRQALDASQEVQRLQQTLSADAEAAASERRLAAERASAQDAELLSRKEEVQGLNAQALELHAQIAEEQAKVGHAQVQLLNERQQHEREQVDWEQTVQDLRRSVGEAVEAARRVQAAIIPDGGVHAARASVGLVLEACQTRGIVIANVLPESSAQKLRAGDVLVQVGRTRVAGMKASEATELLDGPDGTEVVVKAQRQDKTPTGSKYDFEEVLRRGQLEGSDVHDELGLLIGAVPEACQVVQELRNSRQDAQVALSDLKDDYATAEQGWQEEFEVLKQRLEQEAFELRSERDARIAEHSAACREMQQHVVALEAGLADVKVCRDQSESSLLNMNVSLFESMSQLEADLAHLNRSKSASAEALSAAQEELWKLRLLREEELHQSKAMCAQLTVASARIVSLEQALKEALDRCNIDDARARELEVQNASVARQVEVLKASQAQHMRQLSDFKDKVKAMSAERDEMAATVDKVREEAARSVSALQADVRGKNEEIAALQTRLAALKSDLSECKEALDEASAEINRVQGHWTRDRTANETTVSGLRADVAKAINAAHAIRGAVVGDASRQSSHGDGLATLLAQVPEAVETAVQLTELAKQLQADAVRLTQEKREAEQEHAAAMLELQEQSEAECAMLRQRIAELMASGDRTQRDQAARITELEDLLRLREALIDSRDSEVQKGLMAAQALRQQCEDLSEELQAERRQARGLDKELGSAREELERLREQLAQMELNMSDLRNELRYKEEANDGSTRQAKADWLLKSLSARLEESGKALEEERQKLTFAGETILALKQKIKELESKVALESKASRKICAVCSNSTRDEIVKKIVPERPVGVGMRITDTAPHRVVELLPTGAAARSNLIRLQDRLITVNDLQVHEVNDIGLIRSNLVGAKGSTVVLRFERHKPKNDEERVITVSLIRS